MRLVRAYYVRTPDPRPVTTTAIERIPVATATLTEDEANAVRDVVRSGWLTMGPQVARFEEEFATFIGASHAVAMCNGTVTLHALLEAIGIGVDDEVIVPTLTYVATANVVLYQAARLVLCECNPETYNVDVAQIEAVITPRTRAIITVDMNGLPIDYDPIVQLARAKGIALIADSAESLGAKYNDGRVGKQAFAHSFSFYGNKNITTGEGGMVTTEDSALAERLRILRNQGQEGRYNHTFLGYNYRMTEVAAAIGISQLSRIEATLAGKERVVSRYNQHFAGLAPLIDLPCVPGYVGRHGWYMYAVRFSANVDRDAVMDGLEKEGIETRVSFPPVHIQPYYANRFGFSPHDFPVSYKAWSRLLNLPIWPGLSDDQIERIALTTIRLAKQCSR